MRGLAPHETRLTGEPVWAGGATVTNAHDGRAIELATVISELARDEGVPVGMRHVCSACALVVNASGLAQYVSSDLCLGEPVHATDLACEQVAELQVTLGEGPSVEAVEAARPTLVPDLSSDSSLRRWPGFAPAGVEAGVSGVFAFPLQIGAIELGVLEIYRAASGNLSIRELTDALLFADMAMMLLVGRMTPGARAADMRIDRDHVLFAGGFGPRWDRVHQATGVVSTQLCSSLDEAFVRLRAHAFVTGRSLAEVAVDVIEGSVRLQSDR